MANQYMHIRLISHILWRLFKLVELTQVMHQTDKYFIEMLSKILKVLVDESSAVMLRSRLVDKSNSNYPKYGLQVFVKKMHRSSHKVELLSKLSNNEIKIHLIDTIPTNCKITMPITAAQNQRKSKTDGHAKILKLRASGKVMLTVNIDKNDQLINGLMGIINHFEMIENAVSTIFIEFDDVDVDRNLISTDLQSKIIGNQ